MIVKIALVVHPNINGWFEVLGMDENGQQHKLAESSEVGRALTYAAASMGQKLVLPLSGPDTQV